MFQTQWQHLSSDSPHDAGPAWSVSLWDQQQHWEAVDQWGWRCDRYSEHPALWIFTLLKLLSRCYDWVIVVFAVLLTKKPRGYLSKLQGPWNALKVLWHGLVLAVYQLKKIYSFIRMKMLVLSSFNILFLDFCLCVCFSCGASSIL